LWLGGMLQGDFGISQTQKLPVAGLIAERMSVTLPLTISAMIIMAVGFVCSRLLRERRADV